ncbi:MAG: glycosyltransferase family 4 protein [Chitinophagaceae bacterium]|nr:glycosyltransferase family 4 protein [Oligoflexus sp.]
MQRNQSGTPPRILTFNHHESYLCAIAGLNAEFDVVTRKGNLDLSWNTRSRAVPSNFSLIDWPKAKVSIRNHAYHAIICHTILNLFWLLPFQRRNLIFVAHIPLFKNSTFERSKSLLKRIIILFWQKYFGLKVIAGSEWKKQSWAIRADVARVFAVPFPKDALSPRKSDEIHGVYVGNDIFERGEELGWGILKDLFSVSPIKVIGYNPNIPDSYIPPDFRAFAHEFSKAHFYVYPITPATGDGFNMASLEAMLLGLPVVTVINPTSPIVHNINGLVGRDAAEMNEHIRTLILDPALRERLGKAARETVLRDFNAPTFWAIWSRVLDLKPSEGPL